MDKEKLKEFLDLVYELEALTHLAITREDCHSDFMRLIRHKGEEIGRVCKEIKLNKIYNGEDSNKIEEDDLKTPKGGFDKEYALETAPQILNQIDNIEEEKRIPETISEIDNQEIEEIGTVRSEAPHQENIPSEGKERGHLVFSVNDRYRFKRALFGNSDVEFNTTLALVASMENYSEAEDYFINELGMDGQREEVGDFLTIIKKYFGEV